ncbi:MAG TPA: YggT family protein [Patescibacteria group bacterium]|jgi:uncharacterized protein YggT (Ycf19 family)|nr:YggT family protein [Patescibacteria group bacterium]
MIGRFLAGLINIVVGIAELFLGLRVLLKLFGANSANGFVQWVYDSSGVLLDPFRGVFPSKELASNSVVDFSALFAMLVYGIIGMVLIWLVSWLTPTETVVTKR